MPDIDYDTEIKTPAAFLGYEAGAWHVSHDQVLAYCHYLSRTSPRVHLEVYGYSHEQRPLCVLQITSADRLPMLESIRLQHINSLSNASSNNTQSTDNAPIILYQGYSIHGDEASGSNAALWLAYYLAAGQGDALDELLSSAVILLDPCLNPDGLQRFSSWVNSNRSMHTTGDDLDREFHQSWPGGRTNHYWFDLNRDWLLLQHPESRGRVNLFHKWKPHILTDHHEMGANSTFFFMPGVPSRTNPLTPQLNQDLTDRIADFHRDALDARGIRYFSKEQFDDFYIGKGSTYPDANGSIGILFEQAGTEGHYRKTSNGTLTLLTAMRNQMITSLSTQKAAMALKDDIVNYQKQFFIRAPRQEQNEKPGGYLIGLKYDPNRLKAFLQLLDHHDVKYYPIQDRKNSHGDHAKYQYVVPLDQMQELFITAIFEQRTSFEDSLFYDVSAYTLPLAYGIDCREADKKTIAQLVKGVNSGDKAQVEAHCCDETLPPDVYGYVCNWNLYNAPSLLYALLNNNFMVLVTEEAVRLKTRTGQQDFPAGSFFISPGGTGEQVSGRTNLLDSIAKRYEIQLSSVTSGAAVRGPDLGSSKWHRLELPRILLLTGNGISGYAAGEMWFYLDQKLHAPVVKTDIGDLRSNDLERFNVILMPSGRYNRLGSEVVQAIREWVRAGGTLILSGSAIRWAVGNGLSNVKSSSVPSRTAGGFEAVYSQHRRNDGSRRLSGAIVQADTDLSHPLCFGLGDSLIAIMKRDTDLMDPGSNPYATPVRYTEQPLLGGYMPRGSESALAGKASVIVNGIGRGRVVNLADNFLFRGTWIGTEKIFANSIFFSSIIHSRTVEKVPARTSAGQKP